MKIPVAVFSCACLALSSCAPTHFTAPSVQPTRAAITQAQGHVTRAQEHSTKTAASIKTASGHAKTATTKIGQLEINLAKQPENLKLAKDVHGELDALTQALLDAGNENAQTQAALKDTQVALADSQTKLSQAETKINKLAADANKAIQDADRQKVKYHRLKAGACTLAAGAVGFIIFHFGRFLAFLGPWAWAVMLGAPAVVFAALWFIL